MTLKHQNLQALFTTIADTIREKNGTFILNEKISTKENSITQIINALENKGAKISE